MLDPFVLAEHYGVDAVRYFFLREVPFGRDGSFSDTAIVNRVMPTLPMIWATWPSASLSMIAKNCDGEIPTPVNLHRRPRTSGYGRRAWAATKTAMEKFEIHNYLALVFDACPKPIAISRPRTWALKKTNPARMGTVLYCAAEIVRQAQS